MPSTMSASLRESRRHGNIASRPADMPSRSEEPSVAPAPAALPARDREFVHGLQRGFAVILAFQGSTSPLTTRQVSTLTGLTRAVARRYLLTLEELGYVVQTETGFLLSARVLELGFVAFSTLSIAEVARPLMLRVAQALRESCSLSALDGHDIVYLERVASNREMTTRLNVGSRLPAHSTAMGRVLLAHLPPERLAEYLATASLTPLTEKTIRDKARLDNELTAIRQRGWAINDGEAESGVRAIAVPVVDRHGVVVAALNSGAHASRVSLRELQTAHLPLLRQTATAISRALGARVTEPGRRTTLGERR